jgi:Ran-binding protein 9/10
LKLTKASYPAVLRENENIYFQLRRRKFIEMIKKLTELQSPRISPRTKQSHSNGFSSSNSHLPNAADYEDVFDHQMELDDQLDISTGPPFSASFDDHMEFMEPDDLKARIDALTTQVIVYGQELRAEFNDDTSKEVREGLKQAFALMAYTDPRESSVAGILDIRERVVVAEELNSAILGMFMNHLSLPFTFQQGVKHSQLCVWGQLKLTLLLTILPVSLGKSSSAALERLCQQAEVLVSTLGEDGGPGAFINVRRDFLN